jgi:hypothetical protein
MGFWGCSSFSYVLLKEKDRKERDGRGERQTKGERREEERPRKHKLQQEEERRPYRKEQSRATQGNARK